MNSDDIVIDMETLPRKRNRHNSEFVESVDWELTKMMADSSLTVSRMDAMHFFFMAAVRGVYIDGDIGDLDTVGYIANNILYNEHWDATPDDPVLIGEGFAVKEPEEVRRLCDKVMFLSAVMPEAKKSDGKSWLQKMHQGGMISGEGYIGIAKKGYTALASTETSNTRAKRFNALASDVIDYFNGIALTWERYIQTKAA